MHSFVFNPDHVLINSEISEHLHKKYFLQQKRPQKTNSVLIFEMKLVCNVLRTYRFTNESSTWTDIEKNVHSVSKTYISMKICGIHSIYRNELFEFSNCSVKSITSKKPSQQYVSNLPSFFFQKNFILKQCQDITMRKKSIDNKWTTRENK